MQEDKTIAEVTQVTKHPVVEVSEGVKTGGFTVHAKIVPPAEKFSTGLAECGLFAATAMPHLRRQSGTLRVPRSLST
jgi:hypothetical protein